MKKAASIILALIFILSLLPTGLLCLAVEAADVASGECGTGLTWHLDENGTLTISGSGKMLNRYTSSLFLSYKDSIVNVIIESGVTRIGDYAFAELDKMVSITIPLSVSEIGDNAFSACSALENVYIENIMSWLNMKFDTTYTVSNPLRCAENLYVNGELLEDLVIPEGVEYIGDYTFVNCTSIKSISIPKTLKEIDLYAFRGCTSIERVYIKDLATWCNMIFHFGVTDVPYDLYLNGELVEELIIPEEIETLANYAFYNTASLKSVTIPETLKRMGYCSFEGCVNLSEISLPDTAIEIGHASFFNTAYCNDEANWFGGVFYVGKHLIGPGSWDFAGSHDIRPGTLTIANSAFDNTDLDAVTIPDSVIHISPWAFSCTPLDEVVIPESITKINDFVFYCSSVNKVTFPETLVEIGYEAFLESGIGPDLVLPDSLEKIGNYAFAYSSGLKNVVIGDNVKEIGRGVFYDTGYYDYKYDFGGHGETVWYWKELYIGDYLFDVDTNDDYCPVELTSIKESTKALADGLFSDLKLLEFVRLPMNIKLIPNGLFNNCISLKEIALPDGVTEIRSNAFKDCTYLKRVTIPASVTYIAEDAFTNTPALTICCAKGSYAESFAIEHSIPYSYMCETHSFTNYISNNDGSCTKDCTVTAYCDNGCGAYNTVIGENVKKHYFRSYTYNNDATCTRNGTKTATCYYGCDVTNTIEATGTALGHTYSNYTYNDDATCMRDGTKTANCDRCGNSKTVVASGTKISHKYTRYIENNNATCTGNATKTAYCDYGCGTTHVVDIPDTAKGHSYTEEIVEPPTCSAPGTKLFFCNICGDYKSEAVEIAHNLGEWEVYIPASSTSEGELRRYCSDCDYYESEIIPRLELPELRIDGYNVLVTRTEKIKYIRYAVGEYSTAAEIKNAPGCVTLNEKAIESVTKENIASILMKEGGVYSFWIKCHDGNEEVLTVDLAEMEQELIADTSSLTVKNLYGVKDYFIAKGVYDNYSDLRANAIVQITRNKIGTKHDYTYLLKEGGTYTVCVRYEDSGRANRFMTIELSVPEPVFTANGLQLKVGNLDGVKVIRCAFGDYDTAGAIKRAADNRAFTSKGVLNGLEEYTIQFREEGVTSVAVVYNSGYEVVYKYNVTKKSPTFTIEGELITIGNLDDFKVIRYAEGIYSTANEIKYAKGSIGVSAKAYIYSTYTARLKPGVTYTFCVQYNDGSYNYFTVTGEL